MGPLLSNRIELETSDLNSNRISKLCRSLLNAVVSAVADAVLRYLQLKLMATVHQTQPNIQMLLATSDYVGALDLITATQDILMRDLAGIQSFR